MRLLVGVLDRAPGGTLYRRGAAAVAANIVAGAQQQRVGVVLARRSFGTAGSEVIVRGLGIAVFNPEGEGQTKTGLADLPVGGIDLAGDAVSGSNLISVTEINTLPARTVPSAEPCVRSSD